MHQPDSWESLRSHTPSRIALGRAGQSLPTAARLRFQLDHARARDAVWLAVDEERLCEELIEAGFGPVLRLQSRAPDRRSYLQRPDWGRRLHADSVQQVIDWAHGPVEVALVVADGLSAFALHVNLLPFLQALWPRLQQKGLSLAPLTLVRQGRVAIGDEVGSLLQAKVVALLVGERPGLSSPDSMGVYLTYGPQVGLTDARRNCLSNIRPGGLSYALAADKLTYLLTQSLRRQLSGVALKEDYDPNRLGGDLG
jgi:ethanolamine ammonia-lyase small subunit